MRLQTRLDRLEAKSEPGRRMLTLWEQIENPDNPDVPLFQELSSGVCAYEEDIPGGDGPGISTLVVHMPLEAKGRGTEEP